MAGGSLDLRRQRSSSLVLAGLMGVFLVFAVAVLLDEDVLAGDGLRSIDDRGFQVVVAGVVLALVGRMLPMALVDLLDDGPAVHLDATGGEVRTFVRPRRFRWEDVVAIEGSPRHFRIRLVHERSILVAGDFEGVTRADAYAHAHALWTAAVNP